MARQQKQRKMERPRFLAGLFPNDEKDNATTRATSANDTCVVSTPLSDDEKTVLLLTNAIAWCLLLTVLCVWQWKKRRNLRRRQRRHSRQNSNEVDQCMLSSSSLQLEHESLVAALQEELHAKSVAENEQAILWRQEKRILQSRIDELLPSSDNNKLEECQQLHEAQLLQQVQELQETVAFLTQLTESQTETLEAKQHEITKLHNILEELQQHMGGATTKKAPNDSPTQQSETGDTTDDDDHDDDDDDDDSISIDSSVSSIPPETGKTRLEQGNKVVLLLSTMPGNLSTSVHQSRLEAIFRHGLQLESRFLETIDGCDSDLTCLRNDLFKISGLHAVYPQVFLVKDGDISFVGDFDTVQELHDARELPQKIGLLLPEDDEEKENSAAATGNNKYSSIGTVLLDTNTASIAGREASKTPTADQSMSTKEKEAEDPAEPQEDQNNSI